MPDDPMNLSDEAVFSIGFLGAPVGLLALSRRRIVRANAEIELLFGWSRRELEGQSIRILYPSSVDYETTGARWSRFLADRSRYEDERFMQKRSGEIFWARARGQTMTPHDPFEMMVWTFEASVPPARRVDTVRLTPREREIAQLIVNGMTSRSIAVSLNISLRTVEVHRAAIMRKMNVRNTAELVAKIIVTS